MDLRIEGTPYFYRENDLLRRMVRLILSEPYSGLASVRLIMTEGTIQQELQYKDGQAYLNGPEFAQEPMEVWAEVRCKAGKWQGQVVLTPTRLWTIYIAQDKHLDYGWIHPVEKVMERIHGLTDFALQALESTGMHWNFETSIWVDEYLQTRPESQREALLSALRTGQFEVGAFWLVPLAGGMSAEEILRSLYFARQLQEQYNIPVRTASLQEVPSLPWGMASLLSGAGLRYLVKGAYSLRNPHLKDRRDFPLAAWKGPDGSSLLVRWDALEKPDAWGGYAEAYKLWRSASIEERQSYIEETIQRYEGYINYPFSAILLAGSGFDEYPQTTCISDFIHWFNQQGWAYPRLVDATWSQYWEQIERELPAVQQPLPEYAGDLGSTWEEWPAQLAYWNTVYRRAREIVLVAESLTALAYPLDRSTHPQRQMALQSAWRGLLQFMDHNIGGITPELADDMRDRKALYAYSALREGERALQGALSVLGESAHWQMDAEQRILLVVNPDSWVRGGIVEIMVPKPGAYQVVDAESKQELPSSVETRGIWPEHYLSVEVEGIPAFGYRSFAVRRLAGEASKPAGRTPGTSIANRFYHLEINPANGGVCSWVDRQTGREVVDSESGYSLNQFAFLSHGNLQFSRLKTAEKKRDSLSESLMVEMVGPRGILRTTYRLYEKYRYVDILNQLVHEPDEIEQCAWFMFPFNLGNQKYHYDSPAAILTAGLQEEGGDWLAGAGRTCLSVQSILAISNSRMSILLATPDAHLVQIGKQILKDPMADSDPRQNLVLSTVMHNFTRNDHAVRQGGQNRYEFRYRVAINPDAFQAGEAIRFGREAARSLPATWLIRSREPGKIAWPAAHSFLSVEPENVLTTTLKVAEDGQGWILRLWECEGQDSEVKVNVNLARVTKAWRCDLLEGNLEQLDVRDGIIQVSIPAHGLRAIRFV